jgi:hypothetical protein
MALRARLVTFDMNPRYTLLRSLGDSRVVGTLLVSMASNHSFQDQS